MKRVLIKGIGLTGKRYMSIHEYMSMDLLNKSGILVPRGKVADSAEEVEKIAKNLLSGNEKSGKIFVKAQVLTGGRGKGVFGNGWQGGVKAAQNPRQAFEIASNMLGQTIVTKQSGPSGKLCSKVLVVEAVNIDKLFYIAILLDRKSKGPLLIASKEGGVEIEEVARKNPSAILTFPLDLDKNINESFARNIASILGIGDLQQQNAFSQTIQRLFEIFREKDATLVEINPLVTTKDKKVMCIDAKFNFDDNALFRHNDIQALQDNSQIDPREVDAAQYSLNYIGLDGNIGCLVNGAGLAMATMDLIKLQGGEPANFLDVGGSATAAQVKEAFRIISSDKRVRSIFVNIFGGIMRCDIIAEGIIEAMKSLQLSLPVVVRLQGTNFKQAKEMLERCNLPVLFFEEWEDASKKAVEAINQNN